MFKLNVSLDHKSLRIKSKCQNEIITLKIFPIV